MPHIEELRRQRAGINEQVQVWDANKGSSVQIKYHPYK